MSKKKFEWKVPDNYKEIIYEDMKIKNYKELCNIMNWKPVTGNAKIAQLKEFERFFDFKKEGHSYRIIKPYEHPKEAIDYRTNNGDIYGESMEAIVCNILASVEANELTLTKAGWLVLIGALNNSFETYRVYKHKVSDFATQAEVSKYEIKDIMEKLEKNLWSSFDNVLSKLKKQYLITYDDVLVYYTHDQEFNEATVPRYATVGQYEIYREIMRDEMDKLECDCKTEGDLYRAIDKETGKNIDVESFYRRVSNLVNSEFGWKGHYKARTIRYTRRQIKRHLDSNGLKDEIVKLNSNVINQAVKSAIKRQRLSNGEFILADLDQESLDIINELQPVEFSYTTDDHEAYRKFGMNYFYNNPEYTTRATKIIHELVEIDK